MKPACLAFVVVTCIVSPLSADPCGMVPPVYLGEEVPIARVGLQQTYVFYQDGVEAFVIRPGYEGKVEEFGMLIPFPEPPAIRKVPDQIFSHVEKAIDPPEVVVRIYKYADLSDKSPREAPKKSAPKSKNGGPLRIDAIRVVREEAVGMYQIAVLEAGSAQALKRWLEDHKYQYPKGMDAVCNDYVKLRWCFVAVKTRVGPKRGVDPKPGQRKVEPGLPPGAAFDGHVQAMGFRFRTDKLVVPMRLSAFNEGELRNVIYLLTDGPRRVRSIPEEYVVRQLTGEALHRNVTGPLPLRVIGGTLADISKWRRQSLKRERDPARHNGHARELFAADLLAVKQKRLSHPHEEAEKMLLNIGERLMLRGDEIDRLNGDAIKADRAKAVATAESGLKKLTMTVLDGDFPREVLGDENLTFAEYSMPRRRNSARIYDATRHAPGNRRDGIRHRGELSFNDTPSGNRRLSYVAWELAAFAGVVVGLVMLRRRAM